MTSIISLKPIDNSVEKPNGLDSPTMTTFNSLPRNGNGSHGNGSYSNGCHVNGTALSGIIDDEQSLGLIPVRDLPLYIEKKKADARKGFHLEYKVNV